MNPTRTPQTDISWDRFAALWMCSADPARRSTPFELARWPLPLLRLRRLLWQAPAVIARRLKRR
jgi:hypothetical protein